MLWIAALLALVAGMPQLALAIVVVVVLNGAFAFVQEYRADRAAAKLADLLPASARVLRDGSIQVITQPSWSWATWCCWKQGTGCRPTCAY
jgi:magnesium-transporting ATPase (P-type)